MKKVFVLGSINMDLVMEMERMPLLGESVIGSGFLANQGGKGANQAVACAKLGCDCTFIGAVGKDDYGDKLLASIQSFGVKTDGVQRSETYSGTCMILFDKSQHDNLLVVDPGANMQINPAAVMAYLKQYAVSGDIFITQLETNLDAVEKALVEAKEIGMFTVLNPAPARPIGRQILQYVDLIVPNETETFVLTGIEPNTEQDIMETYRWFAADGVKQMIITLGKRGSVYVCGDILRWQPARLIQAVDTTSAGDTFIGAVCSQLCRDIPMDRAMEYGSVCSAITVSRRGAAMSIPTVKEVETFLVNNQ